jgi:Uncharacterized conserved protein
MNGIQVLLVTGLLLVAIYFFVRLQNSVMDILLLLLMVATGIVFVLFPSITQTIAHKLGVGRGADLIFYLSIIIFWFVILKLYTRLRRVEKILTDIVRKEALDEVRKR